MDEGNRKYEMRVSCDNCGMFQWRQFTFGEEFHDYWRDSYGYEPSRCGRRRVYCDNCGIAQLKACYWDKGDYEREHEKANDKKQLDTDA